MADPHGTFDTPSVARHWPRLAAKGEEAIEVRHLVAHTAGLCGWVEPIEEADRYDWEKATSLLAAQAPLWEPGTRYREPAHRRLRDEQDGAGHHR